MPRFYDSIQANTLKTEASKEKFTQAFRDLKNLYDDAVFPDITFVIGRFSSMGTVSNSGLLISVDMLAAGEGIPTHEMSVWKSRVVRDINGLVPIVVHELIHSQQTVRGEDTLLMESIREGTADFLSHLICGRLTNAKKYEWADARENEIWQRFKGQMNTSNIEEWLANASQGSEDWPSEMGYYVGYQICEAYYEQAADKKQAIRDMILCTNGKEFLEKSSYAKLWSP